MRINVNKFGHQENLGYPQTRNYEVTREILFGHDFLLPINECYSLKSCIIILASNVQTGNVTVENGNYT